MSGHPYGHVEVAAVDVLVIGCRKEGVSAR